MGGRERAPREIGLAATRIPGKAGMDGRRSTITVTSTFNGRLGAPSLPRLRPKALGGLLVASIIEVMDGAGAIEAACA